MRAAVSTARRSTSSPPPSCVRGHLPERYPAAITPAAAIIAPVRRARVRSRLPRLGKVLRSPASAPTAVTRSPPRPRSARPLPERVGGADRHLPRSPRQRPILSRERSHRRRPDAPSPPVTTALASSRALPHASTIATGLSRAPHAGARVPRPAARPLVRQHPVRADRSHARSPRLAA